MPAATTRPPPLLLVDTNVLLDVVLNRAPWANDATLLLDAISRGKASGFLAGHAVTTIHYIVERAVDRATAAMAVADTLEVLTVVALEAADFHRALSLKLGDDEDAVQVAAFLKCGADFLVTRNGKDFKGAAVPTRTPGELLALLSTAY